MMKTGNKGRWRRAEKTGISNSEGLQDEEKSLMVSVMNEML